MKQTNDYNLEQNIRIPNLFIVGAAKAGTTSLWYLLKQHPNVFMVENELYKEPGYFSELYGITDKYKYLSLFSKASSEKYVGEASHAYLTDPISAQRIYEFNPNSKIIIMLRHPVLRAYSLYNWMIQEGYEYARTFEVALRKEEKRNNQIIPNFFEPVYYHNYMYFSSGLYSTQIQRYINLFKDNVFIGLFEDFVENPLSFVSELSSFLEINIESKFTSANLQPQNPSNKILHPWLSFFTRKFISSINKINFFGRNEYKTKYERDFLLNFVTLNKKPETIKLETYQHLLSLYEEEYIILESQFKLNLEQWRKIDKKIN